MSCHFMSAPGAVKVAAVADVLRPIRGGIKTHYPVAARTLPVALLVATIAGCASLSPDGGFGAVQSATRERIPHEVAWARDDAGRNALNAQVDALLSQPLSSEAAVQIALLNNQGLQATYAGIGIAESAVVQAGRLPNPSFSFSRLTRGGEIEIGRTVLLPVLALLTLPARSRVANAQFEQAQLRATGEVIRVADETRRAWVAAVAAGQTVAYLEQAQAAAEAGAELAQRMVAAGNWSKLQQSREQTFLVEAAVRLARARQALVSERERLMRLLGLAGQRTAALRLPERLPALPAEPREIADAETQALQNRIDVLLARRIADEQLLRYNGMLISVFDLLADARAQIATVNASIEALRDFWVADSMLQMALTGGPVSAAPRPIDPLAAAPAAGGH